MPARAVGDSFWIRAWAEDGQQSGDGYGAGPLTWLSTSFILRAQCTTGISEPCLLRLSATFVDAFDVPPRHLPTSVARCRSKRISEEAGYFS